VQYKIIVDKQPSSNPSSEKKEYVIDIEELRVKGDVYDSLVITKDEDYVMRRLSLSEYGVLSVLEQEVKEPLENVNIELFEGDNYIYLIEMQGNKFYAEYLIKNDFNDIYATKNEMNSAITQSAESIEFSVNQKLTSYATTDDLEGAVTELNSTISQKASEINAEVEKKVDEETITGAYLILKINGDTSEAKLNADKIELSANDILNLLAGNTINLTSKNIVIASDNFNVDKNGNMTCTNANVSGTITSSNATITGGKIKVSGVGGAGDLLRVENSNNSSEFSYIQPIGAGFVGSGGRIDISAEGDSFSRSNIDVRDSDGISSIYGSEIRTPKLTQTSLESIKKNINKFTKNAMDIINNADIYEYNLKSDKDTDKKLIGFIIGNNYKTPTEVISKTGQAIEHGSAIGILWKAFQQYMEQQDNLIEDLTKRLEKLEKEVHHE
jgi:hypothetical protein